MVSARNTFHFFTSIVESIFTGFLTIIFVFVLVPIQVILVTPIFIFRWLVVKSSPFLRPDLAKAVTTRGSSFAAEGLYTKPEMVVIVAMQVEGTPDLQLLRQQTQRTLLDAQCPKTGEILFPELRQNISKWMGYPFWKPLKQFKLEDHVDLYDNAGSEPVTYEQLIEIIQYLAEKPWRKDQALWQTLVMPKFIPKAGQSSPLGHSIVFFRIHHALADGYSILNLMARMGEIKPEEVDKLPKPKLVQRNKLSQLVAATTFFLKVPYETTRTLLTINERNVWKFPEKVLRSGKKFGMSSDPIPLQYFKDIKNTHKVSFTALILALITAGVRETMLKQFGTVPDKIRILFPLPLPDHPNKLRNYMSGGVMSLPLGEPNSMKRLQIIHNKFERLRRSTIPLTISFIPVLMGGLPLKFGRSLRKIHTTLMLTNMPGLSDRGYVLSHPVEEVYYGGGLIPGTAAMTFGFGTYDGKARLLAGCFDTVIPTQTEADELMSFCIRELDILGQAVKV